MPPPVFELTVYGEVILEHTIALDHFPPLGGKAPFTTQTSQPGGEARACIEFARRGWKVSFVGTAGDDDAGEEWVKQMKEAGVELKSLARAGRTREIWMFGDRAVEASSQQ